MKKIIGLTIGIVLGLTTAVVVQAARNSTGTYSLPAGNPVTTGNTVTSAWANNTFADVATTLTASLDRDGKGGMRAPLKLPDGAVGAPALTFTNEPLTGLYRIGASNPAMSVSGSKRQEWTSTGSVVTGTLAVTGVVTVPTPTNATDAATKGYVDATRAIAYGHVNSDGTNVWTTNVTSTTRTGAGVYEIVLTSAANEGPIVASASESVVAFIAGGSRTNATHYIVRTWNTSGVAADSAFDFVVHAR